MPLSVPQEAVTGATERFRVLVAGRRFGKTYLALWELAKAARYPNRRVWYVAPTYRQAKQVAWLALKDKLVRARWALQLNETALSARLRNGSVIELKGADNYDSLRGVGLDFVVLDEVADIKVEAWSQVLRPTLSDTNGRALFIGTPKGHNHFYDMYQRGQEATEGWRSWQFTTLQGGRVSEQELDVARQELDPSSFEQEYEASFVTFTGRAYYGFDPADHVAPVRQSYDPAQDLILCLDFNVAPGVAVVAQELMGPSGEYTAVLDEIWIERGSNTQRVVETFLAGWGGHPSRLEVYGDQTGGAQGTAQLWGSDWDLVEGFLAPRFGSRLWMHRPGFNPSERARINALNARLQTADGHVHLMVSPQCVHLIDDLERVSLSQDGKGKIDKGGDKRLSHLTDALGYYIFAKHPLVAHGRQVRIEGF